jgi:hypothetical protein
MSRANQLWLLSVILTIVWGLIFLFARPANAQMDPYAQRWPGSGLWFHQGNFGRGGATFGLPAIGWRGNGGVRDMPPSAFYGGRNYYNDMNLPRDQFPIRPGYGWGRWW